MFLILNLFINFYFFIFLCSISLSNSSSVPFNGQFCPRFNFDTEQEVLVCPPLNLIYIHIYKNAGTSVMIYLKNLCVLNHKNNSTSPPYYIRDTYKKIPGVRENTPITLKEIENFQKNGVFVFTTIRDPIDRFLSAYHEVCLRKTYKYSEKRKKMSNFMIFVKYVEQYFPRSKVPDPHLTPQHCFITTKFNEKIPVELFLSKEQIDEVLPLIVKRQGGRTFNITPSETRSRQDPEYRTENFMILPSMLDNSLKQSICKIYESDYEYFEFTKPMECNQTERDY